MGEGCAADKREMTLVQCCLAILLTFAVPVHAQPGFISINCGMAEDSIYIDTINITYHSDAKYIETGVNYNLSKASLPTTTLQQLYSNVRSFPNGSRNCYNLSEITKGTKYLLRFYMWYGNYDGRNSIPQFDIYVGVNRWMIINDRSSVPFIRELILMAKMNYMSVCLVNTGLGTPFISALELRPLNHSMYKVVNETHSLTRLNQSDFGRRSMYNKSDVNAGIRYPDDPYDLLWSPYDDINWSPFNTSSKVTNPNVAFQPPSKVMMTAVRPAAQSEALFHAWNVDDLSLQLQVYMHFAELEQLNAGQKRVFTVCCGENSCYNSAVRPEYLVTTTVEPPQPLTGQSQYVCTFRGTAESNLPPIINAIEIFVIRQYKETPTRDQDVEAILDIKSTYQLKRNWVGDPCVPKNYSWEGLACNYALSDFPTILSLNLSSFGLKGEIAAALANLNSIQSLDMSWNNLTGPIPDFLGDLPSLSMLNLRGNQLSGSVPSNLVKKVNRGSLQLSIDNNPNLITPVFDNKKSRKVIVPVLASVISTLVLLTIVGILLLKFTKRRRQRAHMVKTNSQNADIGSLHYENRQFTYAEVLSITNNLQRSIGKGGSGTVYHGQMTNGTQVAVKLLSLQSIKYRGQGYKEFQNEVHLLMRVHHRNLVPFIGYCREDGNMALIYEYMARGHLGSHLSDSNSNALSWDRRLRIALDVAQGLEYLHNGCKPPIIHRDVKTANILLNERLEAKIGDFGLSKVFSGDSTHVSTAVKGTFGYLDPEYCNSNNLTEKSDVYSFGVVLLQLITGKTAIVRISGSARRSLIDWAIPMVVRGDIMDVIDPKLEGNYDIKSIQKVAEIARACTSPKSVDRPLMRDVVIELKECIGNEKPLESAPESGGWSIHSGPVQTTSEILSYLSAR
ncbi:putative LRR receptor-like serine/threonine-protein kinase [Cinnamomum micranthum f. kanehirae]|uniref:non-specific serine/threonine protein kinase n=1 Tax=Cinnamomum micranthum f. kanehirae TaxID=337451 RepID=A0A3S3MR28_9MAGN|nr:putative LRR receptor-like serine/threonine-protein kinase [Cinnamomum micranthum f. kanehirae]